jgi:hypothetical protein
MLDSEGRGVQNMMHEVLIALITVLALALTIASAFSYRRTRSRKVLVVMVAFAFFFLKGLILTIGIFQGSPDFESLLLYSSIADLTILALLFLSLIVRRGKG